MSRGRGGVLNLVGQGVGMVAEYRQHRQSKQRSRENSEQAQSTGPLEVSTDAGPSTSPSQPYSSNYLPPTEPPPSYDQAAGDLPPAGNVAARNLLPIAPESGAINVESHGSNSDSVDPRDPTFLIQDDEEYWELDEAVPRHDSGTSVSPMDEEGGTSIHDGDVIAIQNRVTSEQGHDVGTIPQDPLPCPVIIPQRRPGSRARGFVRAYAPVLDDCGISQETFLKFLKDFDKSSQASPIFTVVSITAAAVSFVPSVTAMIVATVVQTAAQVGARVQGRKRTNDCLDRMNEQLFRPAGLFVFIMKYKRDPVSSSSVGSVESLASLLGIRSQTVDLSTNQIIAKYNPASDSAATTKHSNLSHQLQSLRLASGTTRGYAALPVSAPLIFPDVDAAARQGTDEAFKDKAKDAKKFLAGYLDRRAQNKYAESDPDSALVLPEEQRAYKSQYADPNHPMFNNGLVGFVSGGKLTRDQTMRPGIQQGRSDFGRDSYGDNRYASQNETMGFGLARDGRRGRRGGLIGGLVGLASNAITNRGSEPSPPIPSQNPASATPLYREDSSESRSIGNSGGRRSGIQARDGFRGRGNMRRGRGGGSSMVKKVMKEDILYLMVVNMPSAAELEEARQLLGTLHSD